MNTDRFVRALVVTGVLLASGTCSSSQRSTDQLTGTSLAGLEICAPLASVDSRFTGVRDTVMVLTKGDAKWLSKWVTLTPNEWILFESSRLDTLHIWRMTTNSPRFATRTGLRVGSSIADVLATRDSLMFEFGEDYLLITISVDGVSFRIDDSSATAFFQRFDQKTDPRTVLNHVARIKEFTINGECF